MPSKYKIAGHISDQKIQNDPYIISELSLGQLYNYKPHNFRDCARRKSYDKNAKFSVVSN